MPLLAPLLLLMMAVVAVLLPPPLLSVLWHDPMLAFGLKMLCFVQCLYVGYSWLGDGGCFDDSPAAAAAAATINRKPRD